MSTTELIKSVSVENLCRQRDAIIERIEAARALLLEADGIAEMAGLCNTTAALHSNRYGTCEPLAGPDAIDHARRRLDASGWRYLMDQSGMMSLMDSKARDEWRKQLSEIEQASIHNKTAIIPTLTPDNIRATFGAMHENRQELFERGVINVFKGLGWCYKTNQPQKFGKRIVLRFGGYFTGRSDNCDDLARCLHVLDGKPEPDHRSGYGAQMADCKRKGAQFDADYWSARFFKNGNCHITFKRPDIIDRMNLIIAKHYPGCLPAPK